MKTIIIIISIILSSFSLSYGEWNSYHYEHGLKMLKIKDYDQAQKEFDYYLKVDSHDSWGVGHFGRGLMFQQMGKYDLAISEFKKATENDFRPETSVSEVAYENMGAIYFKQKAYAEAVHAYSNAVKSNPQSGTAHYWLGMSYLRNGELEKAEKEADAAKELGIPLTALSEELKKLKGKH